ncbi:MAG TPA: JAB domain-containing protein [Candidatus Angelobacter sp.]|nr:JAB domain-containing protein [Candidatus Angelobacter sp.]
MDRLAFRVVRETDVSARYRPAGPPRLLAVQAAADIAVAVIGSEMVECVIAIFIDAGGEICGYADVARGSDNCAQLRARDVLRPALFAGAAGLVLAHNHPSPTFPMASDADVAFCEVLTEICDLAQIDLLDSLVVTETTAVALRLELQMAYRSRTRDPGGISAEGGAE